MQRGMQVLITLHRRFASSGVYHEIRAFAEEIQNVVKGTSTAQSGTARKALRDLAFIEACVSGKDCWMELDSIQ